VTARQVVVVVATVLFIIIFNKVWLALGFPQLSDQP
jgi:hypothetical protein